MICHGDEASARNAPEGLIAGSHWYAPVRRFVSGPLVCRHSHAQCAQATSIAVYILYGKRVNRFLDNPDLYVPVDVTCRSGDLNYTTPQTSGV